MAEENLHILLCRILRYTPNLIRDEWFNIGVILEDAAAGRADARLIEEPAEIARVRRLHPAADEALLRSLPQDFDAALAVGGQSASAYLLKLDETLSNV